MPPENGRHKSRYDQRRHPDETIHNDRQNRLFFFVGKFAHQVVEPREISAGVPRHKEVEKQTDKKEHRCAAPAHVHALNPHQNLPPHDVCDFTDQCHRQTDQQPSAIGGAEGVRHLRTLRRVVKEPDQDGDRKDCLEYANDRFLHWGGETRGRCLFRQPPDREHPVVSAKPFQGCSVF